LTKTQLFDKIPMPGRSATRTFWGPTLILLRRW